MARQQTDAAERTQQNKRLVGRASKEAGTAVSRRMAQQVVSNSSRALTHPQQVEDPREYILRGITGYLTTDDILQFEPDEVRFIGDIPVEVNDMKFYRGGTLVLNLQTTDDFMRTLTDAARLSRGHPLLCRMYEMFPRPESPWSDGSHPEDTDHPSPGVPRWVAQKAENDDA